MEYNIHYDQIESYNGTDQYYKYKLDMVKKDENKNIFTVDSTIELLQDLNDDWKVWKIILMSITSVLHWHW